ncbi:DHA2 family efflux MFS transporter permease subunit [uncultured Microbacterium sp.]|uniref:DHA2 family efflux MFS transporter permease subunit n=1 Tax=uncultured Microbacterium sp. TaxID=191216 RepID=UPI0025F20067|nr:DHA2 family efflux MFS transporter permease subunit [uncultured Microbacterium sp.]
MTVTTVPADVDTSTPARTAARDRTVLRLLLAAVFVVFLNETMMAVALPRIQESLHVDATQGQWLTTAFALTMAVVIPTTGWLMQRLRTRTVFTLAMAAFVLGTVVAACSPVFEMLVAGRVIQATGTAVMMPLMMTTVMTIVPPEERGRVMGRVSIVMSVAPAVGPIVSGALIQILPWQGLFWVMTPIAMAMLGIGALRVPNVSETRRVPLDTLSVVLAALSFSALVFGLSQIGAAEIGQAALSPWIPGAVGVVGLGLFVWRQLVLQRTDAALLDLRTFLSRDFAIAVAMMTAGMVVLFGTFIVLPQFARYTLGLDPVWVGAILLPGGLLMGLAGPTVGRLYDRFGPRPLVVPGAIGLAGSLWTLALGLGEHSSWIVLLGAHIALMLSLAFLFTPAFSSSLGSLAPHLYSHGSATIATLQQVAGAAGTAIFVALYATGVAATGTADPELPTAAAAAQGSHLAFLAGAVLSLGVVVLALCVRTSRPAEAPGL